jgi:peptide/nickel transport system ATP-binding protein
MVGIPGSPPSLKALPSGCKFHVRCPYAMDRCAHEEPLLLTPAGETGSRTVACLLHDGLQPPPEQLAATVPPEEAEAPAVAARSLTPDTEPTGSTR